ncbi:MAG: carbon storage regulator CsrA [Planctomycetes bacterium]|nr:carbon storage regulator CsrA [Planctomycetota bacterium]
MLVLSRKIDQQIRIGDDVEITVLEIRGSRVKLGITCPGEIPVHRAEVWRRIERELMAREQESPQLVLAAH